MGTPLEGLEVFDGCFPDFTDGPRLLSKQDFQIAALGFGVNVASFTGKYPRHTIKHTYKLEDDTVDPSNFVYTFCNDFNRGVGRHRSFWLPSFVEELSPAGNASGTTVDIKEVEYDATYLQATSEVTRLGNYICLIDIDGTVNYRKVVSATTGDPETLTVSSAFSKTFTQGEYIICFLYHVRFLSDELTISYDERGIARVELGFIEVYDVTSEADA
jgi:hypothetical protein